MVIQGEAGSVIRGKKVIIKSPLFFGFIIDCLNLKINMICFCNYYWYRDQEALQLRRREWLWSLAYIMNQWHQVSATSLLKGLAIISSIKAFNLLFCSSNSFLSFPFICVVFGKFISLNIVWEWWYFVNSFVYNLLFTCISFDSYWLVNFFFSCFVFHICK